MSFDKTSLSGYSGENSAVEFQHIRICCRVEKVPGEAERLQIRDRTMFTYALHSNGPSKSFVLKQHKTFSLFVRF